MREGTGGDRSDTYGDKDGNPEVGEGQMRNGKAEDTERKGLRTGAEEKEKGKGGSGMRHIPSPSILR